MKTQNVRQIAILALTVVLVAAVFTGAVSALPMEARPQTQVELVNVRSFTPALSAQQPSYAVDGGALFAGQPGEWTQVTTPQDVIVSAVALDAQAPATIYIGAANEIALYRSLDQGLTWLRIPLTTDFVGGVTALAVDSAQRLVYAGTDTAGVFRLRDVGSSMILSGQLLLDEPVLEVAADSTGKGLAFARTAWHLYRAESFGLAWATVEDLHSVPTALAVVDGASPKVFVGTTDRGLLVSEDGLTWTTANNGLGMIPGSRLQVTDLVADPLQPGVVYAATNYLYGTGEVHQTPSAVAMSMDGAATWSTVSEPGDSVIADLMPVPGMTGAVYALSTESRTPLALGSAPAAPEVAAVETVASGPAINLTGLMAWMIAALALLALAYAVATDLRSRQPATVRTLAPSAARIER